VIFGPKHRKFREAVDLIHLGGAFSIETTDQLSNKTIGLLDNQESYKKASITCRNYVADRSGATKVIMESLVVSRESGVGSRKSGVRSR
jgi:3-deoxy-D-manno-octulosonic-acid transferase